MTHLRNLSLSLLLSICIASAARAEDQDHHDQPPQTPPTSPANAPRPQVSLGGAMKGMSRAFKGLHGQITDFSKNASSLTLLGDFERNLVIAKGLVPEKVQAMEGDAKTKALADYRTMMLNLLRQTLDIEDDLIAGKNAEAAEILGKFKDIEKEGHKQFRDEEH